MKKLKSILVTVVLLMTVAVTASATLVIIGTAQFSGEGNEYNLIWDDANSVVWLDYSNAKGDWANQEAWAAGLSGVLTYQLNGYQVDWGTNDWRLPSAYPLVGSEMGDLFYNELGLGAAIPVDKSELDATIFDNLEPFWYWSGTEYVYDSDFAWVFSMVYGYNGPPGSSAIKKVARSYYGLAIRNAVVSTVPMHPADLDNDLDGDGADLVKMAQRFSEGSVLVGEFEAFAAAFGRVDYKS